MKSDKVLERMDLERRKSVLIASKNKIKEGIEIQTARGTYLITSKFIISEMLTLMDTEIIFINSKLEQLTGLNQEKIDKYYKIVEE